MEAFIIHQLQQDSEEVFEKIYHEFHQKLYHYFLKKTKSATVSEDLVQETFIKLWRYRDRLNADLSLSIQIFRIARTTIIDLLRKNARTRINSIPVDDLSSLAEARALIQPEAAEAPAGLSQVRSSLSLLSPMRRKIIEQRLEGLTNQEIAVNLSISLKTVENQINKAFHDIRRHIGIPLSILLLILCRIG
jgi:RNA polymerase sigma-70 factor (ECF subfamily)